MNKKPSSSSSNANPLAINSLVAGTKIEGKITASNDIRIDGTLIGDLDCKGKVIIGPTGAVDGEISCSNALIEGKFDGTLKVSELLSVKDSAKITGDIITDKLVVQSGAVFNVQCQMGVKSNSAKEKSVLSNRKAEQPIKKDLILNA